MPPVAGKKRIIPFVLNWQRVRQLAKLSILNRLTLTMLVIVPLITAFWPNIRATAERYNRAVSATRQKLELRSTTQAGPSTTQAGPSTNEASQGTDEPGPDTDEPELDTAVPELETAVPAIVVTPIEVPTEQVVGEPLQVEEPLAGASGWVKLWWTQNPIVETRVEAYGIEKLPKPVTPPRLPRTWAMAFFAAMSILFADTIFQLCCPVIVRRQSAEQYANEQVALFAAAPSCVSLEHNIDRLLRVPGESSQLAKTERVWQRQLKLEVTQVEKLLSEVESDIATTKHAQTPNADLTELREEHRHLQSRYRMLSENNQGRRTDELRRQFGIIELGSFEYYNGLAEIGRLAILVTMFGYLTGGCIILKIIQEQALNVARAAGWL